jgi:hypothetical protein
LNRGSKKGYHLLFQGFENDSEHESGEDAKDDSEGDSEAEPDSEPENDEVAEQAVDALEEERKAIAAGKSKCPRCNKWIKDKMKNHLYKCWHCDKCDEYVTNKPRHIKSCKGPRDKTPKAEKVQCPVCEELVHPSAMIRHLGRKHPSEVEKYRKRTKNSKDTKEKRANRKRFRAAHPEVVVSLLRC